MGRTLLLLLAFALMGCEKGYDGQVDRYQQYAAEARKEVAELSDDRSERIRLLEQTEGLLKARDLRDSILSRGPAIRYYNDSLSRVDSAAYAFMLAMKMSQLFYYGDTTAATFAYLEALPWLESYALFGRVNHAERFAGVAGSAIGVTQSPQMARLAFLAFERAKQLALAYGDPYYINLADSSYKAVARQVLTMPDSVRHAFGPAPDRPARISWVLATLAAAFMAISTSSRWGWQSQHLGT